MKRLFLFFLAVAGLSSCSTDFDTIAPYKETMVIYGLLNQYDSVQWIRVNKAFLGEANALIMAQERDSINYADILDVRLERVKNGSVLASYVLQRDTSILKDPGLFHYPYEVNYKLTGTPLDSNSTYRLSVRNRNSGVEARSASGVLGNCPLNQPSPQDKFDFTGHINPTVQMKPATGARLFNVKLRFHYVEQDTVAGTTAGKYFDWTFPDKQLIQETSAIVYVIPRQDFYYLCGENIPVNPNVLRYVGDPAVGGGLPMEIVVTAGSEDLYRYMLLTGPSTTVVQERPVFNNIENGIGLFTGRLQYSSFRDMTVSSKLALDTSIYTSNLNFQ
jgi:hypothetical protein